MSAADVACYSPRTPAAIASRRTRKADAPERHQEMQWVSRINRALEEDRFVLLLPADRADPRRRGAPAALRAAAAHARRARRARAAGGIHSGRGALQPDARDRPLGRPPGAAPGSRIGARKRLRARRTRSRSTSPATTLNDEQFLDFVLHEMAQADVSPGALCFETDRDRGDDEPGRIDALHPRAAGARLPVLARRLRQRPVVASCS